MLVNCFDLHFSVVLKLPFSECLFRWCRLFVIFRLWMLFHWFHCYYIGNSMLLPCHFIVHAISFRWCGLMENKGHCVTQIRKAGIPHYVGYSQSDVCLCALIYSSLTSCRKTGNHPYTLVECMHSHQMKETNGNIGNNQVLGEGSITVKYRILCDWTFLALTLALVFFNGFG